MRLCARSRPQSHFGFDRTATGLKHVPEIERRGSVGRIAFHKQSIEPFGLGNFPQLLGRMRPVEKVIGIVAGVINCQDELTIFVGTTARLLDLNIAVCAGMKPDSSQSGIRKPLLDLADSADDFRQADSVVE
jgi:hypothetical protein